jgi:hypothetical protein
MPPILRITLLAILAVFVLMVLLALLFRVALRKTASYRRVPELLLQHGRLGRGHCCSCDFGKGSKYGLAGRDGSNLGDTKKEIGCVIVEVPHVVHRLQVNALFFSSMNRT